MPFWRPKRFWRAAVMLLVLLSCFFSADVMTAVKDGISLCTHQLIPSLFVFLIFANLYPAPDAAQGPLAKKLSLPGGFMGILFLTLTGGFPVGAICVRRAWERNQLSLKQAKRLSTVLFCCGPGFLVNFVGVSLCQSAAIGWLMLAAQTITLLLGIGAYSLLSRKGPAPDTQTQPAPEKFDLTAGVLAGARSMFAICAIVIFFLAIRCMLSPLLAMLPKQLCEILAGLTEVTSGCSALSSFAGNTRICLLLFFCGFGGVCVHLQICGILKECAPFYPAFAAVRLLLGAVSVGIFRLMQLIFLPEPVTTDCIEISQTISMQQSTASPMVFVLLITTTLLFCASFTALWQKN